MTMFPINPEAARGANAGDHRPAFVPGRTIRMNRRDLIGAAAGLAAATMIPASAIAGDPGATSGATTSHGDNRMSSGFVKTADGTEIFFKDWGPKDAQPIHFHHGWPLSADDWDAQLLFFRAKGYRVIAHDRRGHGRSSQAGTANTIDQYAADAAAVVEHLDLRNVVHIGHSTGGGEVARYVARYGQPQGRVAKAVLVAAIPPLMLKTAGNPGGTPLAVFDGFRDALAANRSQFYLDVASGPFYGFNRPGAKVSQGIIQNWWRQGMMGGALAQYEGIKAFSETDQTDDLKSITVPTLVLQGDDDQVVPYQDAAILQAKLLRNSTLKIYPGFPHGMLTTHAEVINPDLLAFVTG
jgi:non-heme chloroperoxidase